MEDKYIYALTGLVILSLAINAVFIAGFFLVKGKAVSSLKDAEQELKSYENKKLSFTYEVNRTVTSPISATVKSPTEEITVPIDTTVEVPIEENVHTTVVINGQEKEIVVPIDTTENFRISQRVKAPLENYGNFKIEENVSLPIRFEIKVEKSLSELGLSYILDVLRNRLRKMRTTLQNTP